MPVDTDPVRRNNLCENVLRQLDFLVYKDVWRHVPGELLSDVQAVYGLTIGTIMAPVKDQVYEDMQ